MVIMMIMMVGWWWWRYDNHYHENEIKELSFTIKCTYIMLKSIISPLCYVYQEICSQKLVPLGTLHCHDLPITSDGKV